MLIQSPFRDYYDVGQKMGVDKTLVYRRRTSINLNVHAIPEIAALRALIEKFDSFSLWRSGDDKHRASQVPGILGFCGRTYAYFHILESRWDAANPEHLLSNVVDGAFTLEGVIERVESRIRASVSNARREIKDFHKALAEPYRYTGFRRRGASDKEELLNAMQEVSSKSVPHSVFHRLGTPIFLLSQARLVTNPCLMHTDFHKIVPHLQAYQEIAMYLGGVLGQPDEAPRTVGDDKLIAQQKGFDDQSFRQLSPGIKKLRRKENRERKKKPQPE